MYGSRLSWCSLACGIALALTSQAAASEGELFIPAGSEYHYQVGLVAPTSRSLGVVAMAGLDAATGDLASIPSALGELDMELGDFPVGLGAAAQRGLAPFDTRGERRCKCKTSIGDSRSSRVAVLYAVREFSVKDSSALESLEIASQYRDGLVIYINGLEVVRRNLDGEREQVSIAKRPRGSEWERFHIAVVPGLLRSGKNTLAVEVRPSGYRSSPRFDLVLRGLRSARLVRGPMLQRHGDAVVVRFTTDVPVMASVEWGRTKALGKVAHSAGGALATQHRARFDGGGQRFFYRVRAAGAVTPIVAAAAAPAPGSVIRFAVYGDMRGGHRTHGEILRQIAVEAPDFVLVTGDLVLRGSDGGDWQRFFDVASELLSRTPYFPVAGNHDLGRSGDERRLMNELFEFPAPPPSRPRWGNWYSTDVADLHFVMLDSNSYEHPEQLEWLEDDLKRARARGARAVFAATHDGPYSRGIHKGNRYAQEHYVPVLARYGVTMLFSGHDHMYQRGRIRGLRYVVSGGGGAPLYPVRCGVKKRPRCRVPDGMKKVASAHHFVAVTVHPTHVELCPKRPNGSALEPCQTYRLP